MSYTWQDVMLNLDVRKDIRAKQKAERDIREEQQAESTAASAWSLGLSILGGMIWGPAGYFLGKQVGTYGADWAHKWEDDEIPLGKFNKQEAQDINEMLEKEAKEQTGAQIISTITDLASAYVQAGGLQEGPTDWTTFGSGEDQWKVFERGTPAQQAITVPSGVPGEFMDLPSTAASADYVPGLLRSWKFDKGSMDFSDFGRSLYDAYAGYKVPASALDRIGAEYLKKKDNEDDR